MFGKKALKQAFCKHRSTTKYKNEPNGLYSLSGIEVHEVCNNCEKVVDESFMRYEGMGFK